jgi:hypothetical protein
MRFLSMVRVKESACRPSEQLMADMGKLMGEMFKAGVLLDTAGLHPASEATLVRLAKGGKISVVDGPFAESKEVVGGYALLKADSKEQAIELTRRFLEVHGDEWDVDCELRQVEEPAFG